MKRLASALLLFVLLLFTVGHGSGATQALTIVAPAEGSVVKVPVPVQFQMLQGGPYIMSFEYARGTNASTGFTEVSIPPALPDFGSILPGNISALMTMTLDWPATGLSGGPYTLRVTIKYSNTGAIAAQGIRNITLDAPDYAPVLTLNLPATASGRTLVTGSVADTDLLDWRLEAISADGSRTAITGGTAPGLVQANWEAGSLADGLYTIRLSARDIAGNERLLDKKVTVANQAPTLKVTDQSVPPGPAKLEVLYTAATATTLTVQVAAEGSGTVVARGQAAGEGGTALTAEVPLDFTGTPAGRYTATVEARDAAGRKGLASFVIRVLAPVPVPRLEPLPEVNGAYVSLRWAQAGSAIATYEVQRSSEGAEVHSVTVLPDSTAAFLTFTDRVAQEGKYSYTVVAHSADGRSARSEPVVTTVDLTPPTLGTVSVSQVDGVGLQLAWTPAADAVGVAHYRILQGEGAQRQLAVELGPTARSFSLPLPPGEYKAVLQAVDRAGNTTETESLPFRVETGALALVYQGLFQPADVPGFIQDDRTWVPLRFFSKALGFQVLWDQTSHTASVIDAKRGRVVMATVGQAELRVLSGESEKRLPLPAPPAILGDRVVVPLRALAEALDTQVTWHAATRTVEILTQESP